MTSVNWRFVIASMLLVGVAGGGTLFLLGSYLYGLFNKPSVGAKVHGAKVRGADELAPPGAVEWVEDIGSAMGPSVSAETVLMSLRAGQSRDQARATRIAELQKP